MAANENIVDLANIECELSVAGDKFAVLGVDMQFNLNAAPVLSCRAVPEKYARGSKPVDSSDASLFWDIIRDSDSLVGSESVKFKLSSKDDNNIRFSADGWVLGAVSVSASAVADGPTAIDFQILHPITTLEKYPSCVGPVKIDVVDLKALKGSNYIELLKNAFEDYKNRVTDGAKKSPAYGLMSSGIQKIDKFVKCDGCRISSLSKIMPEYSSEAEADGFKKYIVSCIESGYGNQTIYSFLLRAIATDLSLCLYMDPKDLAADQLILRPSVPYKPGALTINTSDVMTMGGHQGDWLAPTGVCASVVYPRGGEASHRMPKTIDSVFQSVICNKSSLQVINTDIPVWFRSLLAYVSGATVNKKGDIYSLKDLELEVRTQSEGVKKVLTQYFLDLYRQSRQISISKRFSFTDSKGKLIIPGESCLLTSGSSSGGVLFLVNSVAHQFSLQNNTAVTSIQGTHVRAEGLTVSAEGACDDPVIENGFSQNKNYIWDN